MFKKNVFRSVAFEHYLFVGKLSHWLQLAVGNNAKDVNYILIDRANIRYKVGEYQFFICGNYLEGYAITIIFTTFLYTIPPQK